MKSFLSLIVVSLVSQLQAQQPLDSINTFKIDLSPRLCDVELNHEHVYSESVDSVSGLRIIDANGIPSHKTGQFPNAGNPNTISPQTSHYEIKLDPVKSGKVISAQGKIFGILFSGVEVDPFTNEFFEGKRGTNRGWNITTLTSTVDLGLDCNNAHVQPGGKYHYHGTPSAYLDELGVDGSKMIKVGYAADGYPIYYKYGLNAEGKVIELTSGYTLKDGARPGDGKSAPDGIYDGTYFQDYEYKEGLSELDACNGRIGKTPESDSEYYYVITDNFPSSPICFSAEPSEDFLLRRGGPSQGGRPEVAVSDHRPGERPDAIERFRHMDQNGDGKLSKSEVRGPLLEHFDQADANKDGFLTIEELEQMNPPGR